jgi:hypothetical protein
LCVLASAASLAAPKVKPPAEPAKIKLSVQPDSVAAGDEVLLTVELAPIEGVKINQYPKIQVKIPAREGLVSAAEISLGSNTPPPEDDLASNYFKELKPLQLAFRLDAAAPAGDHELDAKVTYAYCMPASGFCSRKRVPVKIPVSVR